jgi:predicted transcriptional regulator
MANSVREAMMPEPLTVDARLSITETARVMRNWAVREVLVVEDSQLKGMLTDSDIVVIAIASGRHPDTITAGECCDPNLQTVAADDTTERAAELIAEHQLARLPVVDHGRPVGTIWANDLQVGIRH